MRKLVFYVFVALLTGGGFYLLPFLEGQTPAATHDYAWPPSLGEKFPDLALKDINGNPVRLSQYKGKVIILEPIGMNCPACNAFSGAHHRGGFGGIQPQQGLASFEQSFYQYAQGADFSDPNLVFIQLLLYNLSMQPPSVEEGKLWADHFGFSGRANTVVLVAGPEMQNTASFDMIPGFFLIDKQFRLRVDSTGHRPLHDLSTQLLPQVPVLLGE